MWCVLWCWHFFGSDNISTISRVLLHRYFYHGKSLLSAIASPPGACAMPQIRGIAFSSACFSVQASTGEMFPSRNGVSRVTSSWLCDERCMRRPSVVEGNARVFVRPYHAGKMVFRSPRAEIPRLGGARWPSRSKSPPRTRGVTTLPPIVVPRLSPDFLPLKRCRYRRRRRFRGVPRPLPVPFREHYFRVQSPKHAKIMVSRQARLRLVYTGPVYPEVVTFPFDSIFSFVRVHSHV